MRASRARAGGRSKGMMPFAILFAGFFLTRSVCACTVFCVSGGQRVLAGNNEDYFDPATRMWFVPAAAGQHGRVYFGFANGFHQGGMNDAGLFFDGLALEREEVQSTGLPSFEGDIVDRALAECATVEAVLALFGKHDRTFLAQAQLLFADRAGDAAVIEGNAVVRKEGRFLTSTNFRVSKTSPAARTCDRYRIASRMLAGDGEPSVDLCRRVLAATHQESPAATLYSNVYDLNRGLVYLYHFHDYETVVVIDLAAELAKGAHATELSSLFPESFAFNEFRRRAEETVAAERKKAGVSDVDRKAFTDFVGRYRFKEGPAAGLDLAVRLEDDKLFADLPQGGRVELTPRGGASFAAISTSFRADVTFDRSGGAVTGLTVRMGELKVNGEKTQ